MSTSLYLCPQCSRSCGKGLQMREVRCLKPDKDAQPWMWLRHQTSTGANMQHNPLQPPSPRLVCECSMWLCIYVCVFGLSPQASNFSSSITDENCRDRRHNCVMVVQARLCVYSYYKTACCASCTQSAQRAKRQWPAKQRQVWQEVVEDEVKRADHPWNDESVETDGPE